MEGSDAAATRLRNDNRLRNFVLAGAAAAVLLAILTIALLMSGGSSDGAVSASVARHPTATIPKAGAARAGVATATHAKASAAAVPTAGTHATASGVHHALVAEQPDPEAAYSAPAPPSVHHAAAEAPAAAAAMVAPGAPSDAQVRAELREMQAAEASEQPTGGTIGGDGTVQAPAGVPAVISEVIAGANAITDFPYVYGGGHASFVDDAYDCSGSVSYALAAAGLLSAPETSGQLESWGAAGPGKWLTIYANAGHVYMFVDGLRYDTAGRTGVFSTRWQTGADPVGGPSNAGFVARHYPGL